MGQTLSEPITEKETEYGENDHYAFGVSAMQGWRITMEDAHAAELCFGGDDKSAFFGVYDGHGGQAVALFTGQTLHRILEQEAAYTEGRYEEALRQTFLKIDEVMRREQSMKNDKSGATAVACLLKDNKIFCANAGDSRAVVSVQGEAIPLSFDHKPTNEEESRRIMAARGFVQFGRVNGNLALSRAVGDFEFKNNYTLPPEEQIVTANPDIMMHEINDETEFLVLACDGIWDVMSNQEVVDYIHLRLSEGILPQDICESLINACLAPESKLGSVGCDNMTVMIVCFKHSGTMEQVFDRIGKARRESEKMES